MHLSSLRDVYFWLLVVSTVAVFFGVVFEEAEGWMPYLAPILPLQPITEYRLIKRLAKLGWILICVGVMGEGVFEVLLNRADNAIHRSDEASLNGARTELDKAEGKLRQLQVLALARHVENPGALIEALKPFKDRPVLLRSYVGDAEGWLLCISLLDAAQKAHMDATDQCGKWPFDAGKPVTGLDISGPDSGAIADAIVFKGRTTHGAVAESGPSPLLIFVGVKNPFWLPEKALAATAQ